MQVLSYYNINKNHLCINAGATVRTTYAHHFFPLPHSHSAALCICLRATGLQKWNNNFPNLIRQFIESNKTLNNCFYAVASTTQTETG